MKNKRHNNKKLRQKEIVLYLPFSDKKARIVPNIGDMFHTIMDILIKLLTNFESNEGQSRFQGCITERKITVVVNEIKPKPYEQIKK